MRNKFSLACCTVCCAVIMSVGLIYYPKWQQPGTEATLSWDVSGYYFYLPALFIYQDLKQLKFAGEILQTYQPTPEILQAYQRDNGDYVMKYSSGMAVQYLPFFGVAHLYASLSGVRADGFSWPYQLAINLGSLLVACLGIWMLRKILLTKFGDVATGVALLVIVLATNYLDYAAINGAMTHNYLFTWYCILVWCTHRYWQNPGNGKAITIGLILGLMTLTRPTEILAMLIPLLWGVTGRNSWTERARHFKRHSGHVLRAGAALIAMGSIQVIYWLYATGKPLVYSYEEQGFSLLQPRIADGLFDFRIGWLMYSPALVLALAGFYFLYRHHRQLWRVLGIFTVLFLWLTLSWEEWTYGGSLGHRAMIQAYPVLAFPLAALLERVVRNGLVLKWVTGLFLAACIWYNGWLTHHAHKGGLFRPGQMTQAYFKAILGKQNVPETYQFLLDADQ
ncbi:MAG: glycosyltransferase family 39 protein, partial [Saprospiraceae bacterium]|nr:glycosyltransferase family 39 protein [Saprospiraceae bacterium]